MMILVEMADQSGVDRRRRRANKQRERGQQGEGEAEHRRVARLKCGRGGKEGSDSATFGGIGFSFRRQDRRGFRENQSSCLGLAVRGGTGIITLAPYHLA